jgi:hypothetical protein
MIFDFDAEKCNTYFNFYFLRNLEMLLSSLYIIFLLFIIFFSPRNGFLVGEKLKKKLIMHFIHLNEYQKKKTMYIFQSVYLI